MKRYAATPGEIQPGTLVDLFFDAVEHNLPDAQKYKAADGWHSISHAELLADVHGLADGLTELGIERGDRVGLLSENRPEWALADFGMLCLGVLNVPLYPTLPSNQLAFILNDAGACAVFVSNAEQLEKMRECKKTVASLKYLIMFEGAGASEGELTLKDLLELGRGSSKRTDAAAFKARARTATPDDIATLIYTSGTTGQPKGVMLTHNNLYSNVHAQDWLKPDNATALATVSFLPLSHVFQRMVDYCFFWLGFSIAYSTIDGAAQALREIAPTVAVAVPRVYEKLYARILSATGPKRALVLWARRIALQWAEVVLAGGKPSLSLRMKHRIADRLVFSKVRAAVGGRVSFFVSGGAPLAPQIATFFYGAGVLIMEGYGLTETSPVIAVNKPYEFRIGTVGKAVKGTEIAIAEDGEILARGPQIMKGYYKNEEATREAIDGDGWFKTGDIGDIDDDGFLRITDRKKELIVTAGGKNIAPQPIQNAVKHSRFVADAVVIGDKRPYPVLLLVPAFDALTAWAAQQQIRFSSPKELTALPQVRALYEQEVNARMGEFAHYEIPKKIFVLPREFDLAKGEITPKLSVRRKVVEANFQDEIESLYADSKGPGEVG